MINRHKHFVIFQCFKRMLSIGEPHERFSAITQPMARSYVIFSQFDVYFIKDLNNLIFQIFTFNGLEDRYPALL